MASEVIIPPWVRPESPETIRMIDDATVAFQPSFGRGQTQRGIFADPRWGLRRRYRGLRSDEKAAILTALNESRGQFNIIRVTPHTPIRGSFVTSELLTNNTFASGTTGWSATNSVLTVSDRMARLTVSTPGANVQVQQSATLVQYAPYVLRAMINEGPGTSGLSIGPFLTAGNNVTNGYSTARGLRAIAAVNDATGSQAQFPIVFSSTSGFYAGSYVEMPYTSLARCALVDNGSNIALRSDAFDNAAWSKGNLSVTANNAGAPDGTITGEDLVEDSTASSNHGLGQLLTVSSGALDYAYAVALRPGTRTWARILMIEGTGSTIAGAYFNLSTGAVGTLTTGANWSNVRAFVGTLGSGWYYCCIVARKTNAATQFTAGIRLATADNTDSYSGNGSGFISAWRATVAQSSVPTRLVQTTSAAQSATTQTGSALYTKGWPASTNGLLLAGDWFEWQGELKQLTAPVNSDAAGLAYMQFRPSLAGSPADNDPIVVFEPFGRFIYPGTREFENLFGIYGDCEMNLEEIYS